MEGRLAGSGDRLNIKVGVGTWKFLTSTTDYAGTQAPRKVKSTQQPCPEGRSTKAEVQGGQTTIRCNVSQALAEGRPGTDQRGQLRGLGETARASPSLG